MTEEQITRARKALERARKVLDDIYNHNEAARAAVALHYGVSHTELDSAIASLATAAGAAPTPEAKPKRYQVRKDSGSEWARVVDTQTGFVFARYSVLPRKRSTLDGWKLAERHAAKLNAEVSGEKA